MAINYKSKQNLYLRLGIRNKKNQWGYQKVKTILFLDNMHYIINSVKGITWEKFGRGLLFIFLEIL